jgi:hypothetical protein
MAMVEVDEAGERAVVPPAILARMRASPRRLWAVFLVMAGIVLFLGYFRQSLTASVNSDGASMALQAWDMLHGNLPLHGWIMSDVSFYTLEVPVDMLVEAVVGLRPDVVHITAALLYAALVVSTAMLARGRARGWEGVLRAMLGGGIMLAPSLGAGTGVLLLSPDHTGTSVPLLLTLLVLDRARERWYVPVLVCLMLAWAVVSDPLAIFAGSIGVAAACGVRASTEIARRARPPKSRRYDAALVLAALLSIALAHLALGAVNAAGGFYVHPIKGGQGFASLSAMPAQTWAFTSCLLLLFGADFFGQQFGVTSLLGLLHLAGVVLGIWALGAGLRRFFTEADRVTQCLVAGTLVVLVAGLLGTHMAPVQGAHEIATTAPFMAVLAGRLLGGRLARARLEPVLAIGLACYLGGLVYNAAQPVKPAETQQLADWLTARHLTSGLGGYWQSNVTSLASGGLIRIAAVGAAGAGGRPWEVRTSWYDPAVSYANFVVTVSSPPSAEYAQPEQIRAYYGAPAQTYQFRQYTIMVYGYNLLTRVKPPLVSGS